MVQVKIINLVHNLRVVGPVITRTS